MNISANLIKGPIMVNLENKRGKLANLDYPFINASMRKMCKFKERCVKKTLTGFPTMCVIR